MSTHVLFVCSRNRWRSRTAEDLFRATPGWEVKSCGTAKAAVRRASAALLAWSDVIVCMERHHRTRLQETFGRDALADKEILVLDIPDDYQRGDPVLVAELRDALAGRLGQPSGSLSS